MTRAEPYSLKNQLTLSYSKNVGTADRIFRIVSGLAIAGAGPILGWPLWASITAGVFGLVWLATGVLSKCGIYYMIGYSTCPTSQTPAP